MTIEVRVIEDSINLEVDEPKKRLTTLYLRYPRFIHAEFMTHRVFGRNAGSSRAIPVKRMVAAIRKDPATPIHWGQNQKGMQAKAELPTIKRRLVKGLWLTGMWVMTSVALLADRLGAHKQVVNRMVEPWAHIMVVVTSTEWTNFFGLRIHPDAQPEIFTLASLIKDAMDKSTPKGLRKGEWHLPFVLSVERQALPLEDQLKISAARCARTSYQTQEGSNPRFDEDIKLYDRLITSKPLHASPTEHQGTPDRMVFGGWEEPSLHGNLVGFIQHRKTLKGENITKFE